MDATRLVVAALMVAFSLSNISCGPKSPATVNATALNGQNCVNEAKANTFLVKWKEVPADFSARVIHPQSLITKFSDIEKSDLEKNILAPNMAKLDFAEYEFNVRNVISTVRTEAATATTNAWGPADVQAPQAWAAAGGKAGDGVIVAVVDSGVDITHSLLSSVIYTNVGEIPSNSIDDDKNGYIDDYQGFDLGGNSPDVTDGAGHGTHVSGIIAGQSGPNGFTGMAPKAKILPLKFLDSTGAGGVGAAIAAIDYAVKKGAKVINASWGGTECSTSLKQEITAATSAGVVFVNASGNSGKDINNPNYTEWPAAFQMPGKITVGSMNLSQALSAFSNYGMLVDLAAPGENILSTYPPTIVQSDTQMMVMSGTSMATPFVAGMAALLFGINPKATAQQVTDAINNSVTVGHYGVRTQGKLNALAAVNYLMSH